MPVHIQSVHSIIFNERRQGKKEKVDDYAQDLHKLFNHAYPKAQSGGEAEAIGRSVLANQDRLKTKLVGQTRMFEELFAQAHFEEARLSPCPEGKSTDTPPRKKSGNSETMHHPVQLDANKSPQKATSTIGV